MRTLNLLTILPRLNFKSAGWSIRFPNGQSTPWKGPETGSIEIMQPHKTAVYWAKGWLNHRYWTIPQQPLETFATQLAAHPGWHEVLAFNHWEDEDEMVNAINSSIKAKNTGQAAKSSATRARNEQRLIAKMDSFLATLVDAGANVTARDFQQARGIDITPTNLGMKASLYLRHHGLEPATTTFDFSDFQHKLYPTAILDAAAFAIKTTKVGEP